MKEEFKGEHLAKREREEISEIHDVVGVTRSCQYSPLYIEQHVVAIL